MENYKVRYTEFVVFCRVYEQVSEGAIARLERGGPGSSAYVASTGEGWGHAYNLVNHEGEVLLVDGQDHRVESARGLLDGHDEFHLHPEAWHRAAFWDPEGKEL